jgi:hypothetical protein
MKNLIKGLVLSTSIILGLTFTVAAQTTTANTTKKERPTLNLSDTQKEQMKANRESERLNREKFEATFNTDQKAIMADKALKGKEKMEKLNLSKEQKEMMKQNKELAHKNNESFKATLSKEQQEQFENRKDKMQDRMGDRRKGMGEKKPEKINPNK